MKLLPCEHIADVTYLRRPLMLNLNKEHSIRNLAPSSESEKKKDEMR